MKNSMNTINFVPVETLSKMIYPAKNLKNTLFIDVETVSEFKQYNELSDVFKKLWLKKAISADKSLDVTDSGAVEASYSSRAGIFSEFSKIVCISFGFISSEGRLRIKSIFGDDEKLILEEFAQLLKSHYPDANSYYLCGHNIKEFDLPFICRRMVKHGVFMPNMLDIAGKKPWQTEHLIDTMDLWRFGDFKSYTSLELLAATLGIETPKDDIDGSMVGKTYWDEEDLPRIVKYCQKDVVTVARIMMRFTGQQQISEEMIDIVV
jgi:3'-5' exonuclease